MARITHVQHARKPQGTCSACGKPIDVGTAYKWVQPRPHRAVRGTRMVRHEDCPTWQPYELSSSRMAEIARAQAAFDLSAATDADDVQSALDDFVAAVRGVEEGDREAADNIEGGFGHETQQSQELSERAEALDQWASEIEGYTIPDAPEPEECEECDGSGDCPHCKGEGIEPGAVENTAEETHCLACDGTGKCQDCGGEGTLDVSDEQLSAWHDEMSDLVDLVATLPV